MTFCDISMFLRFNYIKFSMQQLIRLYFRINFKSREYPCSVQNFPNIIHSIKNATDRKNGKLNQLSLGHPLISLDILFKQLLFYIKHRFSFQVDNYFVNLLQYCVKWYAVKISRVLAQCFVVLHLMKSKFELVLSILPMQ